MMVLVGVNLKGVRELAVERKPRGTHSHVCLNRRFFTLGVSHPNVGIIVHPDYP